MEMDARRQSDLVRALHRDVRWLETQLKTMVKATACDGDRMREIIAEVLEKAKRRSKRTLSI